MMALVKPLHIRWTRESWGRFMSQPTHNKAYVLCKGGCGTRIRSRDSLGNTTTGLCARCFNRQQKRTRTGEYRPKAPAVSYACPGRSKGHILRMSDDGREGVCELCPYIRQYEIGW